MSYLLLLAPAANHVYAQETPRLAAAELAVTAGVEVAPVSIAGVDYLRLDQADVATVAAQSARLALFQEEDGLLRPVKLPTVELLDSDLVTIPKYPGKTNERFTRLLLNVTLSQVQTRSPRWTRCVAAALPSLRPGAWDWTQPGWSPTRRRSRPLPRT